MNRVSLEDLSEVDQLRLEARVRRSDRLRLSFLLWYSWAGALYGLLFGVVIGTVVGAFVPFWLFRDEFTQKLPNLPNIDYLDWLQRLPWNGWLTW